MLALLLFAMPALNECIAPEATAQCVEISPDDLAPFVALLQAARPELKAREWSPARGALLCRGKSVDTVQFVLPCREEDRCWVQAAFRRSAGEAEWLLFHAYHGDAQERMLWDARIPAATAKALSAAVSQTFASATATQETTRAIMTRDDYLRDCRCAGHEVIIDAEYIVVFVSKRAQLRETWEVFLVDDGRPHVIGASINGRRCDRPDARSRTPR